MHCAGLGVVNGVQWRYSGHRLLGYTYTTLGPRRWKRATLLWLQVSSWLMLDNAFFLLLYISVLYIGWDSRRARHHRQVVYGREGKEERHMVGKRLLEVEQGKHNCCVWRMTKEVSGCGTECTTECTMRGCRSLMLDWQIIVFVCLVNSANCV